MSCPKCGSSDLLTKYIEKDECIATGYPKQIQSEFILTEEYFYAFKVIAKKEYLFRRCRNCQYAWRENTLDSQISGEQNDTKERC